MADDIKLILTKFKKEQGQLATNYEEVQEELKNIFAKKQMDYGPKNIALGTSLTKPEDINFSMLGIWFRMNDKLSRLRTLLQTTNTPNNESIEDTFLDLANYAIIAYMVHTGKWILDE